MDEFAIFRDYQKAMEYQEQQRVNGRYIIDAEELDYWRKLFNEPDIELEKESEEPF